MSIRALKRPSLAFILLIALVLLLAWVMFVVHLDYESMSADEWVSWNSAIQGPLGLVRVTAEDVHPPIYYLLLWAWISIVGNQTLFIMRLTAAFPALLTVALSYRLALDWFKSRWIGLAAAVFLGTCGIFIYYARELRMYAITALLVTASWWYLTRFLRGRKGGLIGYVACVALLAYTFYFSGFVVIAQVVFVVWAYRSKLIALLKAFGVVLLVYVPWIPVLIHQILLEKARTGHADSLIIGKFVATSPTNLATLIDFINTYTAKQPAFALLLIVLAFGSAWIAGNRRWLIAAAQWLLLTIALMFTVNLVFPVYDQRYLLSVTPALALIAGVAIGGLTNPRYRAALIGVVALIGIVTHADAFLPPKVPNRDMLETIAAEFRPGDRIWYNLAQGALGSSTQEEVAYHLQFNAPQLQPSDFVWAAPSDYADVKAVPRVWDVRPYWITIPAKAAPALTDGRVLSETYNFGPYGVRLYAAPPADQMPVQVGDLFTLLPGGVQKDSYHAGDTVIVKSWWQTQTLPTLDYSYVLYLRSGDTLIQQQDNGLIAETLPTSQWIPGAYRLSEINLTLPTTLASGDYSVWIGVYFWQNPQRLPMQTSGSTPISADGTTVQIGTMRITS